MLLPRRLPHLPQKRLRHAAVGTHASHPLKHISCKAKDSLLVSVKQPRDMNFPISKGKPSLPHFISTKTITCMAWNMKLSPWLNISIQPYSTQICSSTDTLATIIQLYKTNQPLTPTKSTDESRFCTYPWSLEKTVFTEGSGATSTVNQILMLSTCIACPQLPIHKRGKKTSQ